MQVSVESTGNLARRMTVSVPDERIDQEIAGRLQKLTRSAKVEGFRPGKVPLSVVKRRYGGQVRDEVVGEVLQSSFAEAITQEKLRLAGTPNIETHDYAPGKGLEYTARFEVYPEISLAALDGEKIETVSAEIGDADLDDMLETIRKQHVSWEAVERAAQDEDQVVIDFTGTLDGEAFPGNEGKDVPIVLGQGRMIEGFESGLQGATAGEARTLDVTFPETYHAKELAGKTVQFAVQVHRVEAKKLPELNEDFAKQMGVEDGNMDTLRSEVRANMQRELDQAIKARIKEKVMDKLLEINKIDVPDVLVESESERLAQQMMQSLASQGARPDDLKLEPSTFAQQAARRVALGLILGELIKVNKLSVQPAQLRETVEGIAATYEHPDEVVKWYYADKRRLSEIESVALEEQAVDWVLQKAVKEEKTLSFKELMNPERKPEEA